MKRPSMRACALAAVWFLACCAAGAATTTWIAGGAGDWHTAGNWSAGVPGPADEAVFNAVGQGPATISADVSVGKLTIGPGYTNAIYFATGVVASMNVAGDFVIESPARLVCTYVSTNGEGTGRVITVGGNAIVNGTLDAYCQGYRARTGPGYGGATGSHGGYASYWNPGPTYGSLTNPTSLGSGSYDDPGGIGGGAIRLAVASNLSVNGLITANSRLGSGHGAAGGSIWLECQSLSGAGAIMAESSAAGTYGGGGGRIAIFCATSTFAGCVSAAGSRGPGLGGREAAGQSGTLWAPGWFPAGSPGAPADIVLTNGFQYYFPGPVTNYWNLTVDKGQWVEFHKGFLALSNVFVRGVLRFHARNLLDTHQNGTNFDLAGLSISGSICVTNSNVGVTNAELHLFPQGEYALAGGLLVYTNSTIYAHGLTNSINPDAGGSPAKYYGTGVLIRCRNAHMAGAVSANGMGFPALAGPGASANGGAGHGGKGCRTLGNPYGFITRPGGLGSGGFNGAGGGAVTFVVQEECRIDGLLSANGAGDHGGSGGSLRIACGSLAGGGRIEANGVGTSYGAGGGRIAVEFGTNLFAGALSVARGPATTTGSAGTGTVGTVFWCQSVKPGASLFGDSGVRFLSTNAYDFGNDAVSTNGARIARELQRWSPTKAAFRWLERSTDNGGSSITNTAYYTLTGLPPNVRVSVLDNGTPILSTNTGPAGTISFSVPLIGPRLIEIPGLDCGTVWRGR